LCTSFNAFSFGMLQGQSSFLGMACGVIIVTKSVAM
jgi:hypothetical protein